MIRWSVYWNQEKVFDKVKNIFHNQELVVNYTMCLPKPWISHSRNKHFPKQKLDHWNIFLILGLKRFWPFWFVTNKRNGVQNFAWLNEQVRSTLVFHSFSTKFTQSKRDADTTQTLYNAQLCLTKTFIGCAWTLVNRVCWFTFLCKC